MKRYICGIYKGYRIIQEYERIGNGVYGMFYPCEKKGKYFYKMKDVGSTDINDVKKFINNQIKKSMETIKGLNVHVLTIDWIDERTTIRQSVDTFENVEDARKALKQFDEEVELWKSTMAKDWKREGDCINFIEHYSPEDNYTSHAVAKITMSVIK